MAEFAYDSPTNYNELLAAGQIFQGIQISICAISFLMSSCAPYCGHVSIYGEEQDLYAHDSDGLFK